MTQIPSRLVSRWIVLLLMTSVFAVAQEPAQSLSTLGRRPGPVPFDTTPNTARVSTPLEYVTSWVGNSLPGNSAGPGMQLRHVQINVSDIYVTPDGKVYTNAGWDEGGRALSIFKNGKLISPMSGNGGGNALVPYGKYIIAGQSTDEPGINNQYEITPNNCDMQNNYPPNQTAGNGCGLVLLNSANFQNTGVVFSGGANLYATGRIFGLAVYQNTLYISEWDNNQIEVYDLTPLQLTPPANPTFVKAFPVQNPVRIATDSLGNLWVTHRDPTEDVNAILEPYDLNEMWGTNTIDRYDPNGNHLGTLTLPTEADGSSAEVAAINITGNTMLVADNGSDLNVKIYSDITTTPTLTGTFGTTGGIYSAANGHIPGMRGSGLLRGMTGIGVDAVGNYYIAQTGAGLSLEGGEPFHGTDLQSYNSTTGVMNWDLYGLMFISLATIDPQTGTDAYDVYHHYKMDFTQPAGHESTWVSDTYDRFTAPDDIRITTNNGGNGSPARGEIHYINGKKFFCASPQTGGWFACYRFTDANQEIPIMSFVFDYGSWYGSQEMVVEPTIANNNGSEFIWRDTSGTGSVANGTFEVPNNVAPMLQEHRDGGNFFLDTNGDVWQVNYAINQPPYEKSIHIRRYKLQGVDTNGVPEYDYDLTDGHVIIYNVPADFPDFAQVNNMAFYPAMSTGGTLFVHGLNSGGTPMVERYDGWDSGNRKAAFTTYIPWQSGAGCGPNQWTPVTFTTAGNFFFEDFWCPHYNLVYRADTGAFVGRLIPGSSTGGPIGASNTDIPSPNMAYQNPTTKEIDLFQENDFQANTLMFRWTPPSTLPNPPPPPPAPSAPTITSADDEVLNGLTWTTSNDQNDPHVISYQLSWSTTSGGPYTALQGGMAPPNPPLDYMFEQNGTWYFVVQAQDENGQFSAYSPELAASTVPYGTTYEAEQGLLLGPGGVPSGGMGNCPTGIYTSTQNSAGERVGCMQPGSTITLTVTVATAGTYDVRLYYDNGDSNACTTGDTYTMGFVVNGGAIQYSGCQPYTGDWGIPGYVVVPLTLNAGANTLVIGNPVSGGADVDRIVIPGLPNGASQPNKPIRFKNHPVRPIGARPMADSPSSIRLEQNPSRNVNHPTAPEPSPTPTIFGGNSGSNPISVGVPLEFVPSPSLQDNSSDEKSHDDNNKPDSETQKP